MAAASEPGVPPSFDPRTGTPVDVAPGIVRLTARNSGPYTFTGTNSYLLGGETVAVVDPGPADPRHLAALIAAIGARRVEAIILTHTHKDHAALAPALMEKTGAPLWFEGRHRRSRPRRLFEVDWVAGESSKQIEPDRLLKDGDLIEVAGLWIDVVATPGHCANHLCLGIAGTPWLLSGDHVMGWSSTMIATPDGSMADYLESLKKLMPLPYRRYLPGHGGPIEDGPDAARVMLAHRELRNRQIEQAVANGARSVGELLRTIYPHLALPLIPAARMTLKAHIEYLAAADRINIHGGLFGPRLGPV